jgi:hypothetical protein
VLVCWTSWQLVFGPGTERNTFALIAPLTSWALVVAVLEKRMLWLMGLSFLLTILAAIGRVEDLYPWLTALHPVGVLLFFAWFVVWNCGEANLKYGSLPPFFKTQRESSGGEPAVLESGDKSPHSKSAPSCFPADT